MNRFILCDLVQTNLKELINNQLTYWTSRPVREMVLLMPLSSRDLVHQVFLSSVPSSLDGRPTQNNQNLCSIYFYLAETIDQQCLRQSNANILSHSEKDDAQMGSVVFENLRRGVGGGGFLGRIFLQWICMFLYSVGWIKVTL